MAHVVRCAVVWAPLEHVKRAYSFPNVRAVLIKPRPQDRNRFWRVSLKPPAGSFAHMEIRRRKHHASNHDKHLGQGKAKNSV